jgi:SAM-dependent methyltransferase
MVPDRPKMDAIASTYTIADQRRMTAAKNYFAWQAALAKPELGRRVVEIGCGIGNFTQFLLDRDAVIAVDSDADCMAELALRFPNRPNLHAVCTDATDLRHLRRFEPDSCVCLNVLEHIEDDRAALCGMAEVLPRGGKLVLLAPAFPFLRGPIDQKLGHFRRYRRAAIAELAGEAGFAMRTLRYFNFAGFFGWWVNARVLKLQEQSEAQIATFDRWVVPVMARAEAVITPPFGQSIFAVLAKQ